MVQKRTRMVIWAVSLAVLLLLAYFAIDIEFIHDDTAEKKKIKANHVYEALKVADCPSDNRNLVVRMNEYIKTRNRSCFISVIKEAHFSVDSDRYEMAKQLAHLVSLYYHHGGQEPEIFSDTYVRFEALNYLTPFALKRELTIDVRIIRSDALREVKSDNLSIRLIALAVLSYFRDDKDIPIYISFLKSGSDEELVMAMTALAHNCSQQAKQAIRDGLEFSNVRRYLARYREKETITRLLETECRVK